MSKKLTEANSKEVVFHPLRVTHSRPTPLSLLLFYSWISAVYNIALSIILGFLQYSVPAWCRQSRDALLLDNVTSLCCWRVDGNVLTQDEIQIKSGDTKRINLLNILYDIRVDIYMYENVIVINVI